MKKLFAFIVLVFAFTWGTADAFPTTPILDAFNRADETPLATGTWGNPLFPGHASLQILTNRVAQQAGGLASSNYWLTVVGPDCEAYLTILVAPSAGDSTQGVTLRISNPGDAGLFSGYAAFVSVSGGVFNLYQYARYDNNVFTQLGTNITGPTLVAGDLFGVQMIGSRLVIWTKQGAGAWTVLDAGQTDTTYTAAGFIGMIASDPTSTVRFDDFGGGTAVMLFRSHGDLSGLGTGGRRLRRGPLQHRLERGRDYQFPEPVEVWR